MFLLPFMVTKWPRAPPFPLCGKPDLCSFTSSLSALLLQRWQHCICTILTLPTAQVFWPTKISQLKGTILSSNKGENMLASCSNASLCSLCRQESGRLKGKIRAWLAVQLQVSHRSLIEPHAAFNSIPKQWNRLLSPPSPTQMNQDTEMIALWMEVQLDMHSDIMRPPYQIPWAIMSYLNNLLLQKQVQSMPKRNSF